MNTRNSVLVHIFYFFGQRTIILLIVLGPIPLLCVHKKIDDCLETHHPEQSPKILRDNFLGDHTSQTYLKGSFWQKAPNVLGNRYAAIRKWTV